MINKLNEILTPLNIIVTIINVIFSIRLGFQTYKLNKQTYVMNQQENKIKQKDEIEQQANKIAVWRINDNQENHLPSVNTGMPVYFNIRNSSDLPIYDVVVLTVGSRENVTLNNLVTLYNSQRMPGDDEERHYSYKENVAPGTIKGLIYGRGNGMGETDDLVYFFRDSSGNIWFRSNNGTLESIPNQNKMYEILQKVGINEADLSVFSNFNI